MAVFSSRPYRRSPQSAAVNRMLRKYPILFGGPFIAIVVGASFALETFTQTKYDLQNQKNQQMAPEEEQRLNLRRRNFDKREEYFRLSAQSDADEEWEPRRIARPAGTPEWGLPPTSS